MNTIVGKDASIESMFSVMDGWTTQFEVNGKLVGGNVPVLTNDPRLMWHLKILGGATNKRILELGALEGAHTKMMIEAGAKEVIAIEGLSDCWLRCLIVKEAFQLNKAKFLFGDFCEYVANYQGEKFDFVSAAGVLYHQKNPAKLIHDLSKITDNVIVWAQVASHDKPSPSNMEGSIQVEDKEYKGKINNYGGTRLTSESYCGGLHDEAFWMYPEEMIRCFNDAGFTNIAQELIPSNINGDCLLFVASKDILYNQTYNFIHVPKVAGSSFIEILKTKCPIIYAGHTRAVDIYSPYVSSVAFVKNPYHRLVSAYSYLIKGGGQNEFNLASQKILKQYKDFKHFVLSIDNDNLMERILHMKPMHYWLCDDNHKIIVEKIFKIEDVYSIDAFTDKLGMVGKLKDIKINTSEHTGCDKYLDDEIISEINKLYSLDFELFGYEKL